MFQRCLSAFFVALVGVQSPAQSVPIPVLIVSGANNHDWAWTSPALQRMLDSTGRFKADITYVPAAMLGDEEQRSGWMVLKPTSEVERDAAEAREDTTGSSP